MSSTMAIGPVLAKRRFRRAPATQVLFKYKDQLLQRCNECDVQLYVCPFDFTATYCARCNTKTPTQGILLQDTFCRTCESPVLVFHNKHRTPMCTTCNVVTHISKCTKVNDDFEASGSDQQSEQPEAPQQDIEIDILKDHRPLMSYYVETKNACQVCPTPGPDMLVIHPHDFSRTLCLKCSDSAPAVNWKVEYTEKPCKMCNSKSHLYRFHDPDSNDIIACMKCKRLVPK